jgi:hypothetical protein
MIKGFTFKYPHHSEEGAGSIMQTNYLAYVASILYGQKFYLFENHINKLGEPTPYKLYKSEWYEIFNFLVDRGGKIENVNDEIIVNYKSLQKYSDLNHDFLVNFDFYDGCAILIQNYEQFRNQVHQQVCKNYIEKNSYKPQISLDQQNEFNISIHVRTMLPTEPFNLDGKIYADYDPDVDDLPSLQPWQYFNFNYNDTDQNTAYYSDLYGRLINALVKHAKTLTNKNIVVNIFSRGEAEMFAPLIDKFSQDIAYRLWLDIKAADTFYWLTRSDLLVCAHSAMSWIASFLNPNISYTRYPFRHPLSPSGRFFNDNLQIFTIPAEKWMQKT